MKSSKVESQRENFGENEGLEPALKQNINDDGLYLNLNKLV